MVRDNRVISIGRYIGNGCFIHPNDERLMFVKRKNRPDWLVYGKLYELIHTAIPGGQVFLVQGPVL